MPDLIIKVISSALFLFISSFVFALEQGDTLPALSFDTTPDSFIYKANGSFQVITLYPAKPSSRKNGQFNALLMSKGICPLAITDISNKPWYAPLVMVEKHMRKEYESSNHNPKCKMSADYEGIAVKTWGLERKAATILVDGKGVVRFLKYGVLSESEQSQLLSHF